MELMRRKIDEFLDDWAKDTDRLPLIVRGARQIGKTESVRAFGRTHYDILVEINFALQKEYQTIFDDGFTVDSIIRNITIINPRLSLVPGHTLIFFDELQACPNAATSLKSFKLDGRYDVICSGSLMGISYKEIESNSVGYKSDFDMFPMDFEEFLWAVGYRDAQIEDLYEHMRSLVPLSETAMQTLLKHFRDHIVLGGMPAVVKRFISTGNFSGTIDIQEQILRDYEEDITKYAAGLDHGRILAMYRKIPAFLSKDNKKFQISKIKSGARNREYVGVLEWLNSAGIVNSCYRLDFPELPIKGNADPDNYRLYLMDTGLLVASLDAEAQTDLRANKNFWTYKGALFENVVASALAFQKIPLVFYRDDHGLEMEFFVRDKDSLIPVEVKAQDGATRSLNAFIDRKSFPDIRYGIKLAEKNIGFNGKIYTFPYFLTFLLRRYLNEQDS